MSQPLLLAQILLVTCFVPLGPLFPFPAILLHQVSFSCFTAAFPGCHFGFGGRHGFPMRISMTGISIHPLLGFDAHVTITLNRAQRFAIFVLYEGRKRYKPLNELLRKLQLKELTSWFNNLKKLPHFFSVSFTIIINYRYIRPHWFSSGSLLHGWCLSTHGNDCFNFCSNCFNFNFVSCLKSLVCENRSFVWEKGRILQ